MQWVSEDSPVGLWVSPLARASVLAQLVSEHDRPYSLPARPRQLEGGIALVCEYQGGRPCGDGAGAAIELDSAAGWGNLLTAAVRLRASGGSASYASEVAVDRAYLKLETGPLALQAGRDVLAVGPSSRAGLMVSRNAAPQDGVRVQLHPVRIPFLPATKISFFYFLDRLREPQRFRGTIADLARAQLDFGDRIQLGGSRMLEVGGQGAPNYGGLSGFVKEHFGRGGTGVAENNRLSFDLAVKLPELKGTRVYYEIAFEDTRKEFFPNSVQYDADHLIGVEVRGLRVGPLRRAFLELEHTGWVSQEHSTFTSGMTNAGHTFGSALGPDGGSLWIRADLQLGAILLSPWTEWLRFVSDTYATDDARGVFVTHSGELEHRQRVGADLQMPIAGIVLLTAGAFGERIGNADLVTGQTKYSAGLHVQLTFTPP
ncbi:MAG TPA: capsule assembly Wzi family protein [Myxococcales bacterium]|nr:capsule assembly Wzi family protein [Myxococcales bacterium]